MAERCAYRDKEGNRCSSDAAEDSSYCTAHKKQWKLAERNDFRFPVKEDR